MPEEKSGTMKNGVVPEAPSVSSAEMMEPGKVPNNAQTDNNQSSNIEAIDKPPAKSDKASSSKKKAMENGCSEYMKQLIKDAIQEMGER